MELEIRGRWIRTCQECGNIQSDTKPVNGEMTQAYEYRKCKRCKSESLDYGTHEQMNSDNE